MCPHPGRFEEALEFFEHAVAIDPLSYRTNAALGTAYWCMGRFEDARRWFHSALELQPNSDLMRFRLVLLYYCAGQYTRALEESMAIPNPHTNLFAGARGAALARNGRREEASRILQEFRKMSAVRYVDPLAMAWVQLGLEDYDGVFDSLSQAVDERSPFLVYLNVLPVYAPLRADSRFAALAAALKLF
jgi:Flp pilus assembly protein TadD